MIRYLFILFVTCQIICPTKSSIIVANNSMSVISNNSLKNSTIPGEDGPHCHSVWNTIRGHLDAKTLQIGYYNMLLIPSGAINVTINATVQTRRYLAVRNETGYFHLNGNRLIDSTQTTPFAGGNWHYEIGPDRFGAPDRLKCLGPIKDSVYLAMIVKDTNASIQYEYSVLSASKSIDGQQCTNITQEDLGVSADPEPEKFDGIYVPPECTDNELLVQCDLIVAGHYCTHKYYRKFCCKSCTLAGQINVSNESTDGQRTNSKTNKDLRVSANPEPKQFVGIYVPPECTDNELLVQCDLIVAGHYCTHKNYRKFCCKSCTLAGQINVSNESIDGPKRTNSTEENLRVATDLEPEQFVAPITVAMHFPQGNNIDRNSNFTINCTVDGYPKPVVYWLKDGQNMVPTDRIHITDENLLVVTGAIPSDSGEYKCLARNEHSEAFQEQRVRVEGIYVPPGCTDNKLLVKCDLIVAGHYCTHKYYRKFCCQSCTLAGQINVSEEEI